MKTIYLILLGIFLLTKITFSQTATDFTTNDCAGTSHSFFAELDAGKVVVIAWVMPCATCIAPALSAYSEVQNYTTSNPGRVVFYLADDLGNTNCSTMSNWANTNGMSGTNAIFTSTSLDMDDYGGAGMPKIIVVGEPSHTVLYNKNGAVNVTDFNTAVAQGLAATGISENTNGVDFRMSIFPNPIINNATLSYSLPESANVSIDLFTTKGDKVKNIFIGKQIAGDYKQEINIESLSSGIYFIKLKVEDVSQLTKVTVAH